MSENVVLEKSYKFALRIVKLYKYLTEEKKEYVMSKSLLSRGTTIGERVKSAQEAESRVVFASEMGVALRNASATEFWLKLLRDSGFSGSKSLTTTIDHSQLRIAHCLAGGSLAMRFDSEAMADLTCETMSNWKWTMGNGRFVSLSQADR